MSGIAIVTGGSSGIGLAVTRKLVSSGTRCVVLGRDTSKWEAIDDDLLHADAEFVPCDIADPTSLETALERSTERGKVKHLVNCAGINTRRPSIDLSLDEWNRILQVNLTAPFQLSCRIAAHMIAYGGGGSMVNIGSMASVFGIPNVAAYASAKAGLLQLTKLFAVEWAPFGIRVNAVNPGYVDTPLTRNILSEGPLRRYLDNRIPVKRLTMPEEVADVVSFLLSPESGNITGQAINVDGGLTAGEPGLAAK